MARSPQSRPPRTPEPALERGRVAPVLSRTAIDGVGARLRNDPSNVVTLAELTLFREQVAASTKDAVEIVRAQTTGVVSARSGKSSQSIVEKLRRQKTLKLSQMQNIEGCRIVVDSITEQDALASRIHAVFDDVVVHDRRKTLLSDIEPYT